MNTYFYMLIGIFITALVLNVYFMRKQPNPLSVYRRMIQNDFEDAKKVEQLYHKVKLANAIRSLLGVLFLISLFAFILGALLHNQRMLSLGGIFSLTNFTALWLAQFVFYLKGLTRYLGWGGGRRVSAWDSQDYLTRYEQAQKEITSSNG